MFSATPAPREIGVLIFEDFQLLDAAGPISVFEMPNRGLEPSPYRLTVYSLEGGPIRASCGVTMQSERLPPNLNLDTLIVSGGAHVRSRRPLVGRWVVHLHASELEPMRIKSTDGKELALQNTDAKVPPRGAHRRKKRRRRGRVYL